MSHPPSKPALSDSLLLLAGLVFLVLGLTSHLLFLSGAMLCLGISQLQRRTHQRAGLVLSCFAVLYFIVVLGYGVGKDMAQRDTATDATGAAATGSGTGSD